MSVKNETTKTLFSFAPVYFDQNSHCMSSGWLKLNGVRACWRKPSIILNRSKDLKVTARGQNIQMQRHDILIVPAYTAITIMSSEKSRFATIQLSRWLMSLIESYMQLRTLGRNIPIHMNQLVLLKGLHNTGSRFFRRLVGATYSGDLVTGAFEFGRSIMSAPVIESRWQPATRHHPYTKTVIDIITSKLPSRIHLAAIAKALSTSEPVIIKYFFRDTGATPQQYLKMRRCELALRNILQGHQLANISADLSFSDQSHMTRMMQSMFGFSPAQIRHVSRCKQFKIGNTGPTKSSQPVNLNQSATGY